MFDHGSGDRLRALFSDQFEPDGDGFLYRKNRVGTPVRVSVDERAAFVRGYARALRLAKWSLVPAVLILIGLLVWLGPDPGSHSGTVAIWMAVVAMLAPYLIFMQGARAAPARALANRAPAGDARSRREAGRLDLAGTSYAQFGTALLAGAALLVKIGAHHDFRHGWGLVAMVSIALIALGIIIQMARKFLADRA